MKLKMTDDSNSKGDCYSAGERASMEWTQRLRGRWLFPILSWLSRCGIRADHVTFLSLLSGLAFCPVYPLAPGWGLALLGLHVVLDGIDGPLARHTNSVKRSGSFVDTVCDQCVIAATTMTLMALSPPRIGVPAGVLYLFLYTMVVAFAMVRNAIGVPYRWIIRPRFYVYGWLVIETYVWPGTLETLIWICIGLLSLKFLSGFHRLRNSL
jgi:phosphatidylglycerophosphate synthase